MKSKRIILITLVVFTVVVIGYKYVYHGHRDIADEEALFVLMAHELKRDFVENQSKASDKYLDNVILVRGVVTELNSHNVTLNNDVFCIFENQVKTIALNDSLTIKGRCIGFDDLFEQVKMDQCNIINL